MSEHKHTHAHDCTCGCDHHHDHDCDCGCHHTDAESVVDNALIVSRKGALRLDGPVAAEAALAAVVQTMTQIATALAVDNDVLGHIKALFECAAGKAAISITCVASPDVKQYDSWEGHMQIRDATLTINVLSLANTDAPVGEMLEHMFAV